MIKNETLIYVILYLLLADFSGNIDSKLKEINTGTYLVTGTEIQLSYDFPWPAWGGEEVILSRDTSYIEFTIEIEYPEGKQDTVRFSGLEGANAGEYQAVDWGCTHPACNTDANLNGSKLTFDLYGTDGTYTGSGQLGGGHIFLDTFFEYRNVGIVYNLEGTKIEE